MVEDVYIRVAYAALVGIFMFCGVLRGCNLWPQSAKTPDELYPARRIVSCIYFAVLLLLPCALNPQSADARLLARCFWILYIPAATSLGYKRFFYGDRRHRRLRFAIVGGVPLAVILVLSAIACAGGELSVPHTDTIIRMAGILGALLTAYLLHVMLWLWHIMSDANARSADRLFPGNFALGMLLLSAVVLCGTWAEFLWGNMLTNTILTATIAFTGAVIILIILHPQRVDGKDSVLRPEKKVEAEMDGPLPMENVTDAETAETEPNTMKLPEKVIDRIERRVRDMVERDRMFLDPNLSPGMLSSRLNVNEKYLSIVLKTRFGKFSTYLNLLRLRYSMRYEEEHPDAKREEVAMKCGFGSVRTYYRIRNDYMELLVKPDEQGGMAQKENGE